MCTDFIINLKTVEQLLQVMVKAIEARDPYTSGHSVRVSQLSRAIAVELGLSAREIEQVNRSTTARRWEDIRTVRATSEKRREVNARGDRDHADSFQQECGARRYHLKVQRLHSGFRASPPRAMDGEGYPAGLTRKTIPLGSRIILISDTIDAMTTDRPYRKRLTLDIVIAELQKCKGTQFDPELVEVAVSSVAVRRLIAAPGHDSFDRALPQRSRRVNWPATRIWRTGGVEVALPPS